MVKTPDRDRGASEVASATHPPKQDNLNQLDALLGLMAELRIIDQQAVNSRRDQAIEVACSIVTEVADIGNEALLSSPQDNSPVLDENEQNIAVTKEKKEQEEVGINAVQSLLDMIDLNPEVDSATSNHTVNIDDQLEPAILNTHNIDDIAEDYVADHINLAVTAEQVEQEEQEEAEINVVQLLLDMINLHPEVDPVTSNHTVDNINDSNNDDQLEPAILNTDNIVGDSIVNNIIDDIAEDHIADDSNDHLNHDGNINNSLNTSQEKQASIATNNITTDRINQSDQGQLNPPAEDNFKFLQDLLFGKEISELDDFNAKLDQKLLAIEQQLYQPDRLINLLLPVIGELLNLKVIEAREEITEAIAPIIDQIIATKSELDPEALSRAIAPILPDAITTQIRQYPQEIATAIGPEMGAAIREQIKIDPHEISSAIAPEMGRAIKEQIVLERDAMVDALYPVIGNTISKYMVEAIREINDKVANAFSVEGVQRKIKAKVQGVSEAELILSEAIKSTVQAIFLIHKGSGLVIAEVQESGEARLESEMVAGMLTAIRSFVNDCIVPEGQISELNEIEYGDSKIVIEVGGYCYLSAIIKGEPSKLFIKKLRDTLAEIIIQHGQYIENFDGDTHLLPPAVNQLLEKLILVGNPGKGKNHVHQPVLLFLILGFVALIAIPVSWHTFQRQSVIKQEKLVQQALANTPELAIYNLQAKIKDGKVFLTGRVPDYASWQKATAVARTTLPNKPVFNEISPVFVPPNHQQVGKEVARLTTVWNEKPGVKITSKYAEGKVTIDGTVQHNADSQGIVKTISQINGVKSVVSGIKYVPLEFDKRIYFRVNSATVDPIYQSTLEEIKQLLTKFPQSHLRIIGHSDRLGTPQAKQRLAQRRAESVQAALLGLGMPINRLEVSASEELPKNVKKEEPLLLGRCVTFEIFTAKD